MNRPWRFAKAVRILVVALGPPFAVFPIQAQQDPTPPAKVTASQPPVVTGPLLTPSASLLEPQDLRQRFVDYGIAAFGPRTLFAPALWAGIRMAHPPGSYPREWRLGAGVFGRNYGDGLARRASMETARFATAAFLHEDFRYRPSLSKNPMKRGLHALAFTFVDKSDSGRNRLALSNFAGAAASGFIGNLYLPPGLNNPGHAQTRAAIAFGGIALQNLLGEFLPELQRATRWWKSPFHRQPVPKWWTNVSGH